MTKSALNDAGERNSPLNRDDHAPKKRKPGRPPGTGVADDATRFRHPSTDKLAWADAAKATGETLSAWIVRTLNAAANS